MPRYQKRSTKSTRLRLPRFEPTFLPPNLLPLRVSYRPRPRPRFLLVLGLLPSIAIFPTAKRFWRATVKDRVRGRVRVRGRLWERLRGRRAVRSKADFVGIEAIDQSG